MSKIGAKSGPGVKVTKICKESESSRIGGGAIMCMHDINYAMYVLQSDFL